MGRKIRKKLKLLVVTDSLFPFTGITKVLYEILPRLKNFEITVLFPGGKSKRMPSRIKNIRFIRTGKIFYFKGHPFAGIGGGIKDHVKGVDIVWINISGPLGMRVINIAKRFGKQVVAYHHLFEEEIFKENVNFLLKPLSPIVRKATNIFYNKCDLILVPSKNIGIEIARRGIGTEQKVIRLGVDSPKKVKKEVARKKLGFGKGDIIIGFLGRISKEKDLSTLIEAFRKLKRDMRNVKLLLIGYGESSIVDELKSQGAIVTGFVKDPAYYLQALDVFVLPSLTETTSLATLEAMACGLPVVATRVGYVKNYIKDRVNGLFFRKMDSRELASKINLILKDKRLRESLGRNAKKTAKEFSWKKTASEIDKVLISAYREGQRRR